MRKVRESVNVKNKIKINFFKKKSTIWWGQIFF